MAIAKTHFLITAAMLAAPLVTAGCASSDENSTEVNPGVVTTGDRDNYRYLRSRDMDRMQRESARQRDAKRAAAKAEAATQREDAAVAQDHAHAMRDVQRYLAAIQREHGQALKDADKELRRDLADLERELAELEESDDLIGAELEDRRSELLTAFMAAWKEDVRAMAEQYAAEAATGEDETAEKDDSQ